MTSGKLFGSFSLVMADSGRLLWTESAGESDLDPSVSNLRLDTLKLPYGAVGVSHFPSQGKYPGGLGNFNDIFVWSTSDEFGRAPNGYSRAFQLPRIFSPEFAGR